LELIRRFFQAHLVAIQAQLLDEDIVDCVDRSVS